MPASSSHTLSKSLLDLRPEHLKLVQQILQKHVPHCTVWAFGSRVSGNAKPTSDLDLALMEKGALTVKILDALKEAFEESTMPIKVDLVDYRSIDSSFQEIINRRKVIIQ